MKKKTSFQLTEEALRLLKQVADKQGISMTALLEILIRQAAKNDTRYWDS